MNEKLGGTTSTSIQKEKLIFPRTSEEEEEGGGATRRKRKRWQKSYSAVKRLGILPHKFRSYSFRKR